MQQQHATPEDYAADLAPSINPMAPWRVEWVEALDQFRLKVRFLDGLQGEIDLSNLIHSPNAGVFTVLADPARFNAVFVALGAVTWRDEPDLAPDAMYDAIRNHGHWVI